MVSRDLNINCKNMSFKVNLYAHRPFGEYTSTRESGKLGQIQRKGGMKSPKSPEAQIKQTNKHNNNKNLKEETCLENIAGFPLKKSVRF